MAILSFIYRHALLLCVPACLLGIYLLVLSIAGLVRTGRQARLLDVPVVDRQAVELAQAGQVVLELEGPIFTRVPAGLEFAMVGPDGVEVPSRATLFRSGSSGVTRGRKELRVFDVRVPGRHAFRIEGLSDDGSRYAELRLIFKRPTAAATVAWIVATILSAAITIGSIVLFSIRFAEVRGMLGPGGTGG